VSFSAGVQATYAGCAVRATYRWTPPTVKFVQVTAHLGTTTQTADASLIGSTGGNWTTNHRLRGIAYLVVKLIYDKDIFPTGIPNVSAVVRGRLIYDPRSSTTAWSNNPALCVRDFLTTSPGFSIAGSAIDDSTVIAAANVCDASIQITSTPTYQTNYTCDGVLDTGTDRAGNLDTLLQAMAGAAYYTQGKWKLRAGAAVSQVLSLNESNLSDGPIIVTPKASRRDLYNACKGKFLDATHDYAETDFAPWVSATYVAQDGGVQYPLAVSMPMVTDVVRAQRLAKIRVQQSQHLHIAT
jgi:hypothetical protein